MKKLLNAALLLIVCGAMFAVENTATIQLRVTALTGNKTDYITLLENEDYSEVFKEGEDSKKMSISDASKVYVYTMVGTEICANKGTDNLYGTEIIVKTNSSVQYRFSVQYQAGSKLYYLLDKETLSLTPLVTTSTYDFEAPTGQSVTNRFYILDLPFHDRSVAAGNWGTICYPEQITSVEGAVVYEIAGRNADATEIAAVEVAVANMVAGTPYLFNATADAQKFFYNPEITASLQAGANGLTGTFAQTTLGTDGYYVVKGQSFVPALGTSAVLPNRAYLAVTDIATGMSEYTPQAGISARFFSVGRGAATDEMRIESGEMKMNGKYLINGKFVIVKDGKTTNVLGFGL